MAKRDRYGVVRKKSKKTFLTPIVVLLVIVAIVFGLSVFFRVQNIEVIGVSAYTPEEIIEASGIGIGDNLFFVNQASAVSNINARLPMVESARVERSLPNRILITVEESTAVAYVECEGVFWIVTGNGKLLNQAGPDELTGLIQVKNVTPVNPEAGSFMEVDQAETLKLSYLKSLLSSIEELGMGADISDLDMANAASPTFRYLNRFTVRMGSNDNTDYKLRMLLSAVMTMGESDAGTFNLSDGMQVHYIPD